MKPVSKFELPVGLALAFVLIGIVVLAVFASRIPPTVTVTNVPGGGSSPVRVAPPATPPTKEAPAP